MTNSVFTLYELSNGDETEGEGVLHSLNIQMSLFLRTNANYRVTLTATLLCHFSLFTQCFLRVPRFRRVDAAAFIAGITGRRQSGNHHHGRWKGCQILLKRAGIAG